jgi:hypothetical protein
VDSVKRRDQIIDFRLRCFVSDDQRISSSRDIHY